MASSMQCLKKTFFSSGGVLFLFDRNAPLWEYNTRRALPLPLCLSLPLIFILSVFSQPGIRGGDTIRVKALAPWITQEIQILDCTGNTNLGLHEKYKYLISQDIQILFITHEIQILDCTGNINIWWHGKFKSWITQEIQIFDCTGNSNLESQRKYKSWNTQDIQM